MLRLQYRHKTTREEAERETARKIFLFSCSVHRNFNVLTAISILLTAISQVYSRKFQFFHGNVHGIFRFAHHLSATAADSGNQKLKVDLRTSRTRGYLHETGTNSDRYEFVSVSMHFFSQVYMGPT